MCNCASCIQEEFRDKIYDLEWKINDMEKETSSLQDKFKIAIDALKWIAEGEHPEEAQMCAEHALDQINEEE